jgi:hypothetical protein
MNMVWIDTALASKQTPKPSRVQSRAGTEYSARPGSIDRRKPGSEMGHHVDRIGSDHNSRVRSIFQHRGHNFAEDVSISPEKLQARFARFLSDASTKNYDTAARQILIATGLNLERMSKRHGVTDVVRLGLGAIPILVYQDYLSPHTLHNQGVRGRGADKPATDDAYLHPVSWLRYPGRMVPWVWNQFR